MRRLVVHAVPFLLAALPAAAQTPPAAPIAAAERAFAADAPALGITGSFTRWSEPDAVVIPGDRATTVREAYPPTDPRPADEPALAWWPNFVGIARSGDLGFSTGGVAVNGQRRGHYVTVWRRQPDGGWKWIYDGGSGASAAQEPGPDSEPVFLPPASLGSASPEAAMVEVRTAEQALAAGAATDQKAAHLSALADDGRLYVAPRPPAIGREAFPEALSAWPATFDFAAAEGGGSSQAGDLVWTYGTAAWSHDGRPARGYYFRIWQKRPDGWKIVLAQLIAAPPPPAPPAAG